LTARAEKPESGKKESGKKENGEKEILLLTAQPKNRAEQSARKYLQNNTVVRSMYPERKKMRKN